MDKQQIPKREYSIKLYEDESNRNEDNGNRIYMVAEIDTYNTQIYDKLMKSYNDKKSIIGLEKVHIRNSYTFEAVKVSAEVYNLFEIKLE